MRWRERILSLLKPEGRATRRLTTVPTAKIVPIWGPVRPIWEK